VDAAEFRHQVVFELVAVIDLPRSALTLKLDLKIGNNLSTPGNAR
jgi:hypothetical protein